jgi:hypothetical protein
MFHVMTANLQERTALIREAAFSRCFITCRSFWFLHRNRCIVSLVRRFAPDGRFLDIGGGNGYVARGLVAAGIGRAAGARYRRRPGSACPGY